jgi:preprotein translocase subunit YajC
VKQFLKSISRGVTFQFVVYFSIIWAFANSMIYRRQRVRQEAQEEAEEEHEFREGGSSAH